jgi:hypothetical protein
LANAELLTRLCLEKSKSKSKGTGRLRTTSKSVLSDYTTRDDYTERRLFGFYLFRRLPFLRNHIPPFAETFNYDSGEVLSPTVHKILYSNEASIV